MLHNRLIPPDLLKRFTTTVTKKKEKLRSDLAVIKICLAKLYF